MRRKIVAVIVGTLSFFGLFGSIGVFVDVDSIWKILGITSPLNFTLVEGRDFHTPLLFILSACVFSIIATTFAARQRIIWRIMGVFPIGVGRISTPVLEPISDNYSNGIVYKCVVHKKRGTMNKNGFWNGKEVFCSFCDDCCVVYWF